MRAILLSAAWLAASPAFAATVKSSVEHKDNTGAKHPAAQAFDGVLSTAWGATDGAEGGLWIELKLDKPTEISSVSVWPGQLGHGRLTLREYGRPTQLTVEVMTEQGPVTVPVRVPDLTASGPVRLDVPLPAPAVASAVKVSIDKNVMGSVYDGVYIAEIALDFGAEPPEPVAKVRDWLGGEPSAPARKKNDDAVLGWFETIANSETGDAESLQKLVDQAGEGAPFVRERARSVPLGWRVQAIPADDVAVEALLKLKDPMTIPAIQRAALRSSGKRGRELQARADYFEAYAELIGGGRPEIAAGGQTGWEPGAVRTYGEPLAVMAERDGGVLVADVGNSRVQRFGADGVVTRSWGAPAGVTDLWFAKGRKYYVSGAMPGTAAGEFELPLDLARVPGKDADGFVTLDAKGRVQVFSEGGDPVTSWKVRTTDPIEPGIKGSAFVEVLGGKVLVVWSDHGYVYDLAGESVADFAIPDGVPNGTTALKGGKFGLQFADLLVMYSTDGFRHGEILGGGTERGDGFEDWDATLDPDGRLWVVTDTGLAIKYKKPGKVDYLVSISDTPFDNPRVSVLNDVLWIGDGDHVVRIDAGALHARDLAATGKP